MKPDILSLSVRNDSHRALKTCSKDMTDLWESQGLKNLGLQYLL